MANFRKFICQSCRHKKQTRHKTRLICALCSGLGERLSNRQALGHKALRGLHRRTRNRRKAQSTSFVKAVRPKA